MKKSESYPILACETQQDWETWLEQHQSEARGVWLKVPGCKSQMECGDFCLIL